MIGLKFLQFWARNSALLILPLKKWDCGLDCYRGRKEHLASEEGAALNVSAWQGSFLGKINTALTFLASFLRQGKKEE